MGLTCEARRAGTHPAASPTTIKTPHENARVKKSVLLRPNRMLAIARVAANEATNPIAPPRTRAKSSHP
jgi:hypothetical protein